MTKGCWGHQGKQKTRSRQEFPLAHSTHLASALSAQLGRPSPWTWHIWWEQNYPWACRYPHLGRLQLAWTHSKSVSKG